MKRRTLNLAGIVVLLSAAIVPLPGSAAVGIDDESRGWAAAQAGTVSSAEFLDAPDPTSDTERAGCASGELSLASDSRAGASNVEVVGQLGGLTNALAVQGDYAYFAEGPALTILDISDPASPSLVGRTPPMPQILQDIAVAGDYAYVAASCAGLRVVDISTPSAPAEVGYYSSGGAHGLAVVGHYVYLADGYQGLQILDVSDPSLPKKIGQCETLGRPEDLAVAGDYAFLTAGFDGLRVVDISTPSEPVEVASYDTQEESVFESVATSDGHAYVTADHLRVLDISIPSTPTEVGTYQEGGWGNLALAGDYAFLADGTSGLKVLDVSSPSAPTEVGHVDTPAEDVAAADGHVYAAARVGGMQVLSVSSPSAPVEVGRYKTPGYVRGSAVVDDYAYVVDGRELMSVDISDAALPIEVGSFNSPGDPTDVVVRDNYAHVADGDLRVVDVSTPTAPTEVGYYDMPDGFVPGLADRVALAGGYAYAADGYQGLRVIDVSTPATPTEVGSCPTTDANDVTVTGDSAYVADLSGGFRIIDVSTPSDPTQVAQWQTPEDAQAVAVSGDYAYVAAGDLHVVDVSTPSAPAHITAFSSYGRAEDVVVAGDHAYVADSHRGLRVVDVSDPSAPLEVGYYTSSGNRLGVTMSDDYLWFADGSGGLLSLRFTGDADLTAPSAVTDLSAAAGSEPGSIDLAWTAPGDDGTTGRASSYIVRYNNVPITADNWDYSLNVSGEPTPAAAGATEVMTVPDLSPGTTYYFAVKARDKAANMADLSNSPGAEARELETPDEDIADRLRSRMWLAERAVHSAWTTTDDPMTYTIQISLRNRFGEPLEGKHVHFSLRTDRPHVVDVEQPSEPTDQNGYTTGSVATSDRVGKVTVRASVIEDQVALANVIEVRVFAPGDPLQHYAILENTQETVAEMLDSAESLAKTGDFFGSKMEEKETEMSATAFSALLLDPLTVAGDEMLLAGMRLMVPSVAAQTAGSRLAEVAELWREGHKAASIAQASCPFLEEGRSLLLEKVAEELFGILNQPQAVHESIYVDSQERLSDLLDDLRYETQQARQTAAPLPPDLVSAWHEDLRARDHANEAMETVLSRVDWGMNRLQEQYDQLSGRLWSSRGVRFASTFPKIAVGFAPHGALIGLALDSALSLVQIQELRTLHETDQQLYLTALNGTTMVYPQGQRACANSLSALESMTKDNPSAPVPVEAQIGTIQDRVHGTYEPSWWPGTDPIFVKEEAFSTLPITNTGQLTTTYQAFALYNYELAQGMGRPHYALDVAQRSIALAPGETGELKIVYQTTQDGTAPDENAPLWLFVWGAHQDAVYSLKDHEWRFFDPVPQLPLASAGTSTEANQDIPMISNPISMVPECSQTDNACTPHITVHNPFTIATRALLTQTLPPTVTVPDPGQGVRSGQTITWPAVLQPGAAQVLTYELSYSGTVGSETYVSTPQLQMQNPANGETMLFDTEGITLTAKSPLKAEAHLPTQLLVNRLNTLPITVTNALTDGTSAATLEAVLADDESGDILLAQEHVSLGADKTLTVSLPITPTRRGLFLLQIQLDHGADVVEVVDQQLAQVAGHTFSAISPRQAPAREPFTLTITGTGFLTESTVSLGGLPVPCFSQENRITSVVPGTLSAGTYSVTVDSPDRPQTTIPAAIDLVNPTPVVSSVAPAQVPPVTSTLTITGGGFAVTPNPPRVSLDETFLLDVGFVSDKVLTATLPADFPAGVYTLTVTNLGPGRPEAEMIDAIAVVERNSPTRVSITGPTKGAVGADHLFTATVAPLTATVPLTYTWDATQQSRVVRTNSLSDTVSFSWLTSGTQSITVTARNWAGAVTETHAITVREVSHIYLPCVLHRQTPDEPFLFMSGDSHETSWSKGGIQVHSRVLDPPRRSEAVVRLRPNPARTLNPALDNDASASHLCGRHREELHDR